MLQEEVLSRSRPRRLSRWIARSLLLLGALAGVGQLATARADTVFLRDGRIVRGDVRERADGKIEIVHRHGALIVDRNEIARVDSDANGPGKGNPFLDTVWTTDGRVLSGNVTISEETKEIVVTNEKFGGETRIPRDLVRQITFRKGKQAPAGMGGSAPAAAPADDTEQKWRLQIDALITKLRDPTSDKADRTNARHELLGIGIYASQYIKDQIAAVGSNDQVVGPVLNDVLRVAQLKTVVAASIEEKYPNICERLIDPSVDERVKAVQEVALYDVDSAPPLLLHLIRHDPAAKVKSICVGELSILKRYEDLGSVLKMHENGQLRFVAALELGEAGIYAGIPVIIEALRLEGPQSVEIRKAAIEALKKYTSQGDLGYLPEGDDKGAREEAVKRWEAWWAAEGQKLVDISLKSIDKTEISDADKTRAIDRWREGNRALDEIDKKDEEAARKGEKVDPQARSYAFEMAAHLFKEATDKDPTLCSAHLSRALVLYEQLNRPREAETILKQILSRFAPQDAKYPRLLATYHLGRLAFLEGDWKKAQFKFDSAVRIDESFEAAWVGAGDCSFELALAAAPSGPVAGGAGGGDPQAAPTASPSGTNLLTPDAPGKPDAKAPEADKPDPTSRREHLVNAIRAYRAAIDAINKKAEALKSSARDLGGITGETEDFASGRLLTTIKRDRENLTKTAATVWFRLGRAQSAKGDAQEALIAFKAARTLDNTDPRYNQAVAFWEDALKPEPKSDAAKPADEPKPADKPGDEARPGDSKKEEGQLKEDKK